jgi:VCBS repeat-containing protein
LRHPSLSSGKMRARNRRRSVGHLFYAKSHFTMVVKMSFQRVSKSQLFKTSTMVGLGLVLILSSVWISVSSAQDPVAHIRVARVLKTSKLGIQNPAGLAFSMSEEMFHVVQSRGMSQPPPTVSDIIMVTARSDQMGSTRIPAAIDDPINMAFDNSCNCLLILQPNANGLMQVSAGRDGRLIPSTLTHFDARLFGLQNPQGMAIDPANGDLFILDSTAAGLVRVARAPDGSFDENGISRVDLRHLGSVGLRGLAIDPTNGHLHVLDSTHQVLYEITPAGQVLAERDLSPFDLIDPRGIVFAPSGDQTDNATRMSLYVADSGLGAVRGNKAGSPGRIMELSLADAVAAAASSFQSSVVHTTDMSVSPFTPPSPDPSGLTYIASRNTLLMCDGEVEETVSGITHFQGANVWEMTLSGGVVDTANISTVAPTVVPMTDEPTGVAWNPATGHFYFSDDSARKVHDLNPGADGQIGTSDDRWTSFDTRVAGNDDPEGITYDTQHDRLFVVDGVNMEVYEYTTTGVLVSQFDVQAYGVVDPESVEFSPELGTLFVLSNKGNPIIIETTTGGTLLQTIDVSADNARAPAGLAYAPASSGSGAKRFYIVDRGIDNNTDPNIIDGKMYEMTSPSITEGNSPPAVYAGADQTVTLSLGAHLQGTASNVDGLPTWGTLTVTWSKAGGPGTVTFSNANDLNATASFSSIGTYVLRLIADDGELVASDDVNINVTGDNGESVTEVRVTASTDDAEESDTGNVDLASSDLELVFDGSNQTVGMRFNGIAVPRGAEITSAYVQFKVDEVNSETTALTIQGQNADQADTFSNLTRNISSRSRTTAAVSWSPNPWATVGAVGVDQRTPNIALVIQEIVNRTLWASGNSLAIIITGTGHRTAEAFDGDSPGAPLLHVEYRVPTGNHAPVANAQSVTTNEDTAKAITLTGSDVDGNPLTYAVVTGPSKGTLSGSGQNLTYTPTLNSNGADSFTFKVNDGTVDSAPATVSITVTPVNDAPVANAQSVTTNEDAAKAITLTGSDVDGNPLTYAVVTGPSKGTLSGSGQNLTYTPTLNSNGADSFTFKVNDGAVDSAPATVSITVTAVNDTPVANAQSVSTPQNTGVAIALTGSDVEGSILTYSVATQPTHGTLSGTAPNLTYAPSLNYTGPDSFTFMAYDGQLYSSAATVSITVTAAVNHPPVANAQLVTTAEDTAVAITLAGGDADNDPLTYIVVTTAGHGTLSGTAPNLTYTPTLNYNGSDSFTFKTNDGKADSSVATVSITITPVNDAPVAVNDAYTTYGNTSLTVSAPGVLANDTDVDSTTLTAAVGTGPSHGTLTLNTNGSFTYTPATDYLGSDSFTYYANDGANSSVASVTITVQDKAPTANAGQDWTIVLPKNSVTLAGTASDDWLPNPPGTLSYTWSKVSGPGTVAFSAPSGIITKNTLLPFTTTATFGKTGNYTLRLTVSDGGGLSFSDDVGVTLRRK